MKSCSWWGCLIGVLALAACVAEQPPPTPSPPAIASRPVAASTNGPLGDGNPWDAPFVAGPEPAPIEVSGFRDATHHWRDINEPERVIQAEPGQPSYPPTAVREIAANILMFQRSNGGWPKDYDMLAVLTRAQKRAVWASRPSLDTTFDNDTTHAQVEYLAKAYTATNTPAYRDACLRGFDFLLAAQYENGGFPQRMPHATDYHAHITFNDGVMVGIMKTLDAASRTKPEWAWLDAGRRERARLAVSRGVACILECQIRVGDVLTGWAQQHDEKTFAPAPARSFELTSLSPQDTTEIARFLMHQPKSPEITASVEAAVAWLHKTALSGIRVSKVPAPHAEFERHKTDIDVVVVQDPKADQIWARFYEIDSGRPIFASRDGVKVYSLAEVDRERRTGSTWYGNWPAKLLARDYPEWQKKHARASKED